jgi:hypothetical protein
MGRRWDGPFPLGRRVEDRFPARHLDKASLVPLLANAEDRHHAPISATIAPTITATVVS